MNLGISTYTYTWSTGVPGFQSNHELLSAVKLLRKAKALGVNTVQICDNYPLHAKSENEIIEIAQLAKSENITIELGTRGVNPEHLYKYLNIAKILNVKLLRTLLHSTDSAPDLNQAEKWLRYVIPDFEKAGIAVAIENHDKHKTGDLINLIKRVDNKFLGICLDTVNSFGALECPDDVINALAPYAINLHIKDFTIVRVVQHQMGFSVIGTPAGDGLLDIDRLLSVLKSYGKEVNAILELWTPFTDSVEKTIELENEWAVRSIQYLRGKIG